MDAEINIQNNMNKYTKSNYLNLRGLWYPKQRISTSFPEGLLAYLIILFYPILYLISRMIVINLLFRVSVHGWILCMADYFFQALV